MSTATLDTYDAARAHSGLAVGLTFLPTLEAPSSAQVDLFVGDEQVDTLTLAPAQAWDAFTHPACYSRALCEILTARPVPDFAPEDPEAETEEVQV